MKILKFLQLMIFFEDDTLSRKKSRAISETGKTTNIVFLRN